MNDMNDRLRRYRKPIGLLFVCGAISFSGCSAGRPPTAMMSKAELAVQHAEQSKAPEYASQELSTARQKYDSARRAMNAEHYEKARRLAEEALVDAQLAESRATAENAQQTVKDLQKAIESLRAEAERAALSRETPHT